MVVARGVVFVVSVILGRHRIDSRLTSPNGIAFSEFRGRMTRGQLIATSQPDNASGCGTSKDELHEGDSWEIP